LLQIYKKYTQKIHLQYKQGDSTEPSFYGKFAEFLEELADEEFKIKTIVTSNPKKVLRKKEIIGLPDFVVKTKEGEIIGYVEAKEPMAKLQDVIETEQIDRYRKLPNFILTNYCEFYFFRYGNMTRHTFLFDNHSLKNLNPPQIINPDALKRLFQEFFSFSTKQTKTAEQLAIELADRAKILKHVLIEELDSKNNDLLQIFKVFEGLIKGLTKERFANLYSQTIAYGLFFAATEDTKNELTRVNAYSFIPNTLPILSKLFYYLTGANLPKSITFIVDDIIQVLKRTLLSHILKQFLDSYETQDLIVHFYETFLTEFDPELKDRRGVFYTPAPVVSYIINSVHYLLQKEFHKNEGLAEPEIKILDPAAGSMTFIDKAINVCYEEYERRGKLGVFNELVNDHILEDFYAFEILIAPYTIGHFKIFNTLKKLKAHQLKRLNLFLTNTLEIEDVQETSLLPDLSEENKLANEVKQNTSISKVFVKNKFNLLS